jgi:ectoine hydroxylase-related dioxygenase (phytanoyl-CoA dioxygenase family)
MDRFGSDDDFIGDTEFAGQYLRDPHKQDPRIITASLIDIPLADTVRCLLGPRIQLRNSNVRRARPGRGDATIWHPDYRPHTDPVPPLPSAPPVITVLIYLDALNAETGPLFVLPGSHRRPEQPAAPDGEQPGQIALKIEPGQIVMMNAALWHRGGPNYSADKVRRLVTLQLSGIYMTTFNFEPSLPSPAFQRLLEQAKARQDEPLLELLGAGGINPASAGY